MKIATLALAAGLVLSGSIAASAASTKPVDKRLANQADRIEDGRRDGSITWTEGRKLRREQRDISGLKNEFLADGHLSRRESRVLRHKQELASWNIISEKHDRRRRLWWLPRVGR
jgi:hypothetical protein